jgi:NADH dehydrogenase
VKLFCFVF